MLMKRTILLPLLLLFLVALLLPGPASADDPNQAALVICFGDGRVETRCVAFADNEITGADLLARSGLDIVMDTTSGMGVTVCQIAGEGCAFPADPCFCGCMSGGECAYWNYFYRDPAGGNWIYSTMGASIHRVKSNSIEGWVWGDGHTPPADDLTFEAICASPTPTPTLRAEPTRPSSSQAQGKAETPASPAPLPATAVTVAITSTATHAPTRSPTAEPPTTTPSPEATATGPNLSTYWPFTLMVLALVTVGAFIRFRRT